MDNKKRAQAAWTALLALLALLFLPQVNLPRNSNASESPAEDPAPDDSGEENQQTNDNQNQTESGDGAEDPSSDGTSDGGWVQDDPENIGDPDAPTGTPDSGGDAPAPEGGWGVDDGGEDVEGGNESPTGGPSPATQPDNPASEGETVYGQDDILADLWDNQGTSVGDLTADAQEQLEGAAAVLALPTAGLASKLQEPVEDATHDAVQWAQENPEAALLITGGIAATGGGALLISAYGPIAVSSGTAGTLLAGGVATRSSVHSAEGRIQDVLNMDPNSDGDDSSSGGGASAPDDEPWSPAPGGDSGDEDDVADPDAGEGGHIEIPEPEPDPVSAPDGDPWAPAPGDNSGDEDDIADPDSGEGGYLSGGFV